MPIRWKLFGIANYLLLIVFGYLLWQAFRFIIEVVPDEDQIMTFPLISAVKTRHLDLIKSIDEIGKSTEP